MTAFLNPLLIEDAVRRALNEDLGRAGDVTTLATIPAAASAQGLFAARAPGIIAGLALAEAAFRLLDPGIGFRALVADGDRISPGERIAGVVGPARGVLGAERVALNFLCHLSGVATLTAAYAARVEGTRARIVCTRKTLPGIRAFQKYAVALGGGVNHRHGLDDAVLIKDNHIAVAGGIGPALRAAKAAVGHLVKVEIEVDGLAQLDAVLDEGADAVLFDNMRPEELAEGVRRVAGRMRTEASGGVSLDNVAAIAASGVDVISVGALTHSAPALDIGLDVAIEA